MMTATNEKTAAQMPAIASVPPKLWMKNGNVERLMMWFVKTQRFTRMIRTRSFVHSFGCVSWVAFFCAANPHSC